MAEYVCELTPDDPNVPYDSDDYSGECVRRERVVRCRDCVHWRRPTDRERRERVVRCRDCVHWRRPTDRERSRCTGAMAFVEPAPDGFCAWGREREADDQD